MLCQCRSRAPGTAQGGGYAGPGTCCTSQNISIYHSRVPGTARDGGSIGTGTCCTSQNISIYHGKVPGTARGEGSAGPGTCCTSQNISISQQGTRNCSGWRICRARYMHAVPPGIYLHIEAEQIHYTVPRRRTDPHCQKYRELTRIVKLSHNLPQKNDKYRREGNGRRCCLRDRIY